MKRILVILLLLSCAVLTAMQLSGNPHSWKIDDFIGFDNKGDAKAMGDLAGAYARIDDNNLYLRLTFYDMAIRKGADFVDNAWKTQSMQASITVGDAKGATLVNSGKFSLVSSANSLLSPSTNMFELVLPLNTSINKNDCLFNIKVYQGDTLSDSFLQNGNGRTRGSNIAFVHHGNQGLTYTEVFYGQFPAESSGFDEVLEVHQARQVPGNFHMSGTLMPAAEWHNPEFNDWLSTGVTEGWVAMLGSALGQHIMPFVQNEMNNWAVSIEQDMVEYRYNYRPHVAWVPERVWLAPGAYPGAGVIDWLGDNWVQHGVNAVILDDNPHLWTGSNTKIHWVNNGSGITLRAIPINNSFVGAMHSSSGDAINFINNNAGGDGGISVYGTDWEVAAEMNEHHDTFLLDDYETVINYCADNYPGVNVWKLDDAINNTGFDGTGIEVTPGTYGLLGGGDGYGGSNNSWYTDWAGTASHSDHHDPAWTYGYIWDDAYSNIINCPDNALAQLAWYVLMINLHETGWHDEGVSGWQHRYSSHIKNANVYAEASRWADGQYEQATAAYLADIDHDGDNELVMHNNKAMFVFEAVGGRAQWVFIKDDNGNAHSVVGSDVAYYPETDGDYNESSNNHVAALSDVSPNYQNDLYQIEVVQGSGNTVQARFSHNGLTRTCTLSLDNSYLEVSYLNPGGDVYVKNGWTTDLLDLIWSGKDHLQRMWNSDQPYCGRRNSASGATSAIVMGSAGAQFSTDLEGTLVMGDEIHGGSDFRFLLYAGYTSAPYDEHNNKVTELDNLAAQLQDENPPTIVNNTVYGVGEQKLQLVFSEPVAPATAYSTNNYNLSNLGAGLAVSSVHLFNNNQRVILNLNQPLPANPGIGITVNGVTDANGNVIAAANPGFVQAVIPHLVGSLNSWAPNNHDYDFTLADNGLWYLQAELPAGLSTYKAIETDAWDNNDFPVENLTIDLLAPATVNFVGNFGLLPQSYEGWEFVFYQAAAVGDFLSAWGGTNWQVDAQQALLSDTADDNEGVANNGIYAFNRVNNTLPAGNYEFKIVLDGDWGQTITPNNVGFGMSVPFSYNLYWNAVENTWQVETLHLDTNEHTTPAVSNKLGRVFPNPFNPSTTIQLNLPVAAKTQVKVYNLQGRLVNTLCNRNLPAGKHSFIWNGTDANNRPQASGVYLVKMLAGNKTQVVKALLMK